MKQFSSRLTATLSLETPPVALTFVSEPPADVVEDRQTSPSACTFWRRAEHQTFYAPADAHFNCPIGAMVMGFDLPQHVGDEVGELMATMCECEYVDPDEAGSIPTQSGEHAGIVYGPLAQHPSNPTVVLMWVTPRQAMLCNEARGSAKWSAPSVPRTTGRPACAALPLAVSEDAPVMSFGCAGMRTFTEVNDDRMLLAVPGPQLPTFVTAAESSVEANAAMDTFYRDRKSAIAAATDS